MSQKPLRQLFHQLRRAVISESTSRVSDARLLDDFVQRRDEAAFELLVWRHSSLVLGTCQRLLRDVHEAEDAFQATFLTFARKAGSIGKGDSVGSWLYKVAFRVAQRARSQRAKRACQPLPSEGLPAPASADETFWRDLRPALEEEVNRLPDKYRRPFVLCHLEGNTNEEAARLLGCPKGTVLSRLARGRERLRGQLTRRGLVLSAELLAVVLAQRTADAAAPLPLVDVTVNAAQAFAAGNATVGLVSARAVAWSEGVLKAMLMTKLKIAAAIVLAVALVSTGTGLLVRPLLAQARVPRPAPAVAGGPRAAQPGPRGAAAAEVRGVVKSVDDAKGTLTVNTGGGGRGENAEPTEQVFTVPPTAEVALGSGSARRMGLFHPGKLADLAPGALVVIRLTDAKAVDGILAEGPAIRGVIKTVEADKRTITVSSNTIRRDGGERRGEAVEESKTYAVSPKAEIAIDDGRGKTFSLKEAKLTDLPQGAQVSLKLSADQMQILSLVAEGPAVHGTVKSVDGEKSLTLGGRGDDHTYDVAPEIEILLDDGKGRLLSVKEGKLSDIPAGAVITGKLAADQKAIMSLRAEGPVVQGQVKSVDADKGTITLAGRKGRGDVPEEDAKTYVLAKEARILVDGKEGKLAGVKPDDSGPHASLKLSLDQKVIQNLVVGGEGRGRR